MHIWPVCQRQVHAHVHIATIRNHARVAEASCASAVRTARDFAADLGTEAASRVGGLLDVARCSDSNAERDTRRVLANKFKLSLPIPLSPLGSEDHLKGLPVLRLRDWANYLISTNKWHIVAGLRNPHGQREGDIFQCFWDHYRKLNPNHQIFSLADSGQLCLRRTCPLAFHGDEGRSRKHQPFLVCSVHSLLGYGLGPSQAALLERERAGEAIKRPYLKQNPNFLGHSYTHRFILGCLTKKQAANKQIFQSFLGKIVEEAAFMHDEGVACPFTGLQYHMALIAVVGDWPWLAKAASMERHFSTMQKHRVTREPPKGFCHYCLAGTPAVPAFRDLHSRSPGWLQTMYVQEPWVVEPALASLLHEPGKKPAIFQFDLFDCVHLGVGRHVIGAALALMSDLQPATTIDQRFDVLTQKFLTWCKNMCHTPFITKLSKESIGWGSSTQCYPSAQWHKGSVTTTVMLWIEAELGAMDLTHHHVLRLTFEGIGAINSFLRGVFSSEIWIPASEARLYAESCLRFLRRYSVAAAISYKEGMKLFGFTPKCHALQKIVLLMIRQSLLQGFCCNPAVFSVQPDEDLIGRASRLSRKVHPARAVQRVLERYLQSAYAEWVRAGFLVSQA